jgi:hypothetical protein
MPKIVSVLDQVKSFWIEQFSTASPLDFYHAIKDTNDPHRLLSLFVMIKDEILTRVGNHHPIRLYFDDDVVSASGETSLEALISVLCKKLDFILAEHQPYIMPSDRLSLAQVACMLDSYDTADVIIQLPSAASRINTRVGKRLRKRYASIPTNMLRALCPSICLVSDDS